MIYRFFLETMAFLTRTFGYKTAINIKNYGDSAVTLVIGGCIAAWLWAKFWSEVEGDPKLRKDLIIFETETSPPRRYVINNKNTFRIVVGFVAWLIIRFISHKESFKVSTIRPIIAIIMFVGFVLLCFGLIFTFWSYIPDGIVK